MSGYNSFNPLIEICGDGINLGMKECDDGNVINGDGCSSECKVEEGFICVRQDYEPDVCYDTTVPQATLSIKKGNLLVIDFNKGMVAHMGSVQLALSMTVQLRGAEEDCMFSWKLVDVFHENYQFDKLTVKASPRCSLQGAAQTYVVTFNDVTALTSPIGYSLKNNVLRANALRYIYISEADKRTLSAVGESFSSTGLATLGLMLGVSAFQSVAIQSLWNFINMLQMLSYISLIDCYIPQNLEIFLNEYLTIRNLAIPFSIIPEFKYNPLSYIDSFLTEPFNDKFFATGYESISFIFNLSDEILTWLLLFLLYFVLKLLCFLLPKSRYLFSLIL